MIWLFLPGVIIPLVQSLSHAISLYYSSTWRTWESALTYCEGLSLVEYTDWRLPNIKEIRSIVNNTKYDPSIDTTYFPNTNLSDYWSSTTYASNSSVAWYVYFSYGHVYYYGKSSSYYVRCVRGGTP